METNPAKKLGKLSLAILENFVESKLGDKFIKELRQDYDLVATITVLARYGEFRLNYTNPCMPMRKRIHMSAY